MSSSESSDDEEYVLYKDRPEWRDIIPSDPEDAFPHQVVRICYSTEFKDAFDYFRAISEIGELSERTLKLTADCIKQNAANYTVWDYRRRILVALNIDLKSEFEFTSKIISRNIKNFQLWHHRQVICTMAKDGSREIGFTNLILAKDEKNYHAWQHRQWTIKQFDLFDGELETTAELLKSDVYNNSAWNHRFFVIKHTTGWTEELIRREIDFALDKITLAMDNESSWSYLRAVIDDNLTKYSSVVQYVTETWKKNSDNDNGQQIRFLAGFYVDLNAQNARENEQDCDGFKQEALSVLKALASEIDPIRKNYWGYLSRMIADI